MLLHIFADTYAHQSFNGFHNKNMNDGWVSNATAYYGDGTKRNKSYSGYAGLPAIGHAVLGSAPDETALVYTCYRNDGTGNIKKQKERVNAFEFLNCAHEILKILRAARAASAPTEAEFGMLDRALGEGFGIDCSRSIRELCTHWSQKVPSINGRNINYSYDKDAVHDSILFIAADSLPEGMSEQRARELLSVKEMDDETEKELERLTATNALRPTRTYYYYNTCAYYIRKMVNQ